MFKKNIISEDNLDYIVYRMMLRRSDYDALTQVMRNDEYENDRYCCELINEIDRYYDEYKNAQFVDERILKRRFAYTIHDHYTDASLVDTCCGCVAVINEIEEKYGFPSEIERLF